MSMLSVDYTDTYLRILRDLSADIAYKCFQITEYRIRLLKISHNSVGYLQNHYPLFLFALWYFD